MPGTSRHVRDITHPGRIEPARVAHREVPHQEIRRDGVAMSGVGGHHVPPRRARHEPLLLHQARDQLLARLLPASVSTPQSRGDP